MNPVFVDGVDKLKRRIATIRSKVSFTLNAVVEDFASLLLRRIKERYSIGVDPDGNPWADLRPATLERKKRYPTKPEYSTTKGFSTEALFNSLSIIRGTSAGLFAVSTGVGVRIGIGREGGMGWTKVRGEDISIYARVFQKGNSAHNQVARRFLGIGRLDVKSAGAFLNRRVKNMLGSAT